MPSRAPVPETGVSTNSTSRVFFGDPIEAWFDGEKEEGACGNAVFAAPTQTAETECSRLLPTWCAERGSNPHAFRRRFLKPTRIPVPAPAHLVHVGRLELPCPCGRQFLRLACLPIPPAVHVGTQSESRTRKPVLGVGPSDRCVYHFTICAYWQQR